MTPTPSFRKWRDQLLLAVVDADEGSGGGILDLGRIARTAVPEFKEGWVRKAAGIFEENGWIRITYTLGGGPDGGMHVELLGQGLDAAEDLRQEPGEAPAALNTTTLTDSASAELIPGSDRFVTLDHNSREYREAVDAVAALENAIRVTNLPIFADEGQRLAVLSEVQGIQGLLKATTVRVAAVWQAVRENGVLRWLTNAGAGGVLGNVAYDALKALSNLLGWGA